MKIGIVLGSIREGRFGEAVATWEKEVADQRTSGATYELVDLKAFDVPLLTTNTHPMMANKSYDDARVQAWSDAIDACDGYVFVTAEYNHAVPGAFKNAVDSLGKEWVGKPVGFLGYGSVGGVRAIENWRTALANFSMADVRAEVNINSFFDTDDNGFAPLERRTEELNEVFKQVEEMAEQLRNKA